MNNKIKSKKNKPDEYVNNPTKDVWSFLGFEEDEKAELSFRLDLFDRVIKDIEERGSTQKELVELLGETQPRISDLVNRKLAKFSCDKLISYLHLLNPEKKYRLVEEPRPSADRRVV